MECIRCNDTNNVKAAKLFLNGEYFKTTTLCENCIEKFGREFRECLENMIDEAEKNK